MPEDRRLDASAAPVREQIATVRIDPLAVELLGAAHPRQPDHSPVDLGDDPIATRIESGGFYPAEAYHQAFAQKHPFYPYIVFNDRPKVAALKAKYPSLFKA